MSEETAGALPRPIRVLQLVLSLAPGGTERLVLEIAKRLPPPFASVACCLDFRGAWAEEMEQHGIPVFTLGRTPGFHPSLGRRIARLVEREGIDVVHCHQYSPFVYTCIAKLLRPRTRVIFTEHGRLSDTPISLKRRLVNGWLGRIPNRSFAVCRDLRRFLVAEGFPASRLEVAYNGIELGDVPTPADRGHARAALGLGTGGFVVGTVARLDPVKSLSTLIEAFALVARSVPGATLVIVGDGPEREGLEALAGARNLSASVLFSGHRSDARALLPAFDVYANSSLTEGVSLTIVEAMAAALPVVATSVGGNPEVVAADRTGALVPPRDPHALAAAIASLAADEGRGRAWGTEGRRTAEDRFPFDRMLDLYAGAYLGRD